MFSSVSQSCPTLCNPMDCSTPGFPVHHQLPELAQIHVHQVSDAIQPSHPPSSPSPPTFSLSQHPGFFQWVSSSLQVAKVLKFQLQYQSFQWVFRMTSFRMDWLNLLAVQRTVKSLLQHHSSKASILQHSAFFLVQLFYLWQFAVKISKNILAPEMGFSRSFSLCMSLKVLLIFFFHTPWNFHIRFFWAIALSISITNPERQLSNLSYPKYQKQAVEKFVTKTVNHWPI